MGDIQEPKQNDGEQAVSKNSIVITISEDKMTAYGSFILLENGPHGFTPEGILDQLKMKGIKFDPELIDVFFEALPALKQITERYPDENR